MYRFLNSTRWFGWFLMVCVFGAACAGLGNWQMNRLETARTANAIVEANYEDAPLPYAQASGLFEQLPGDRGWTPVALRGEYLVDGTVVVRNRPLSGAPGYEVLVPFRTLEGDVIAVDRGWLPIGNDSAGRPDSVPAPPAGVVDLVVRAKIGEPAVKRNAPEGQIASIELPAYERMLGYDIQTGAYGVLATETPSTVAVPASIPRPELNEGNHLSYSLQWFAFAVMGFVGLGYAARQQARINREDREAALEAAADGVEVLHSAYRAPRKATPKRRGGHPTDEEEEDAYLDRLELHAGKGPGRS